MQYTWSEIFCCFAQKTTLAVEHMINLERHHLQMKYGFWFHQKNSSVMCR